MTEPLKTGTDGLQLLIHDHATLTKFINDFKTSQLHTEKKRLIGEIIKEMSIHTAIEEEVTYPLIREKMGAPIVEKLLREHQQLKELLYQIEKADFEKDLTGYMAIFNNMENVLKSHIQDEEHSIFPQLRNKLTAHEVEDMGRRLEHSKKIAPTHPHPGMGTKEGFTAKVMDTLAAGVDKARDAMA